MTNKEFFIERWNHEIPGIINAVKAVPEAKWDWTPHPKTRTAKQLIDHFVTHAEDLNEGAETGAINHRLQASYASTTDAVAAFETQSAKLMSLLSKMSDSDWDTKNCDMLVYGSKVGNCPIGAMCWSFLFDIIHHRGQLSVYYRPMGTVNPSIYGPTAEMVEEMMAKSAQN